MARPGTCVFTFDDGPDVVWTPRVLAELARCGVKATFFVVAERVRKAPGLVRAMVGAGHDVELHCDRHLRHTRLSRAELERDTRVALATLARVGVSPTRWRTPWGVRTPATAKVAAGHGLKLVGWTVDTHDWRGDDTTTMLARARGQLTNESVVLMHDGLGPGAQRAGCAATVDLIEPLATVVRERMLHLAPLSAVGGEHG